MSVYHYINDDAYVSISGWAHNRPHEPDTVMLKVYRQGDVYRETAFWCDAAPQLIQDMARKVMEDNVYAQKTIGEMSPLIDAILETECVMGGDSDYAKFRGALSEVMQDKVAAKEVAV